MRRQHLSKILTHHFFIGFILTGIIIIAVRPEIHKYKAEVVDRKIVNEIRSLYYSDLDNDKNSEEIRLNNKPEIFNIILLKGKGVIEQYNLFSKPLADEFLYFEDCNDDGNKELFLLTIRSDSILLSIIDPMDKRGFIIKERLIFYNDTIKMIDLPISFFLGLIDSGTNNGQEIVFAIVTGFSKQPRSFYNYDITNDILKVSPLSGVSFREPFLAHLNSDTVPDIFFTARATGNYHSYIPYNDECAWLMVLDKDLEFLFEPVEFPGFTGNLSVIPYQYNDSNYIVALHHYQGVDTIPSGLYLFDQTGNKLYSKPVDQINAGDYYLSTGIRKGTPLISMLDATNCKVSLLNNHLEEIYSYAIPELDNGFLHEEMDIDLDGKNETIFGGKKRGTFVIFREEFRHPLVVDLEEIAFPLHFSPYLLDGVPYLYAEFTNNGYILRYKVNPLYYWKYPLLFVLYIAVSFFVLLVFRLQKYRAERDYNTKQKINELQILTLKNQIDPHFTFNILNSIGSLYTRNADPDLAYNVFAKYSNLLRFSIKNSDKIRIPIEEELNFVNTYVELEQFRSGHAFKYEVTIEKGVDFQTTIPRMLIHTFVENSIKHGVRMVKKDALLELIITRNSKSHKIIVRDNGPGLRVKSEKKAPGTGKGIQIIDDMIRLFHQLEGIRINYTIDDISLKDPNHHGTEAIIIIPG